MTVRSSAGTIPFSVATAAPPGVVSRALPYRAGAAPATPGTPRTVRMTDAGSSRGSALARNTLTWAVAPRMRKRISDWRPVISPSAMSTAATPFVTPRTATPEMTEMNACLRFATR